MNIQLSMDLEKLRFPIGRFYLKSEISDSDIDSCLISLSDMPNKLQVAIDNTKDELLQSPYRPEGWTRNQVIHHLADSHLNSYSRCKMAYTENFPHVKPYNEKVWALLEDAADVNIGASMDILHGVHYRWNRFWDSLDRKDFEKMYFHPELDRGVPLSEVLQYFAWHGEHHIGHVNSTWKIEVA